MKYFRFRWAFAYIVSFVPLLFSALIATAEPINNDIASRYLKGSYFFGIEKYNSAIQEYSSVILLDDKFQQAYLKRGAAYLKIGAYNESREDFLKVVNLSLLEDDKAYFYLGSIDIILKDYVGAVNNFTKAIDIADDIDSYYWRAEAYSRLGDYRGSLKDYLKILEKSSPGTPELHIQLGLIYGQMSNWNKSIYHYSEAILLDNNSYKAYYLRGFDRILLGIYSSGLEDINRSIALNESFKEPYFARGLFYFFNQEYHSAYRNFSTYIEYYPDIYKGYYYRAISGIILKTVNHSDILQDFNSSINLASSSVNLTDIYTLRSDYLSSKKMYKESLRDIEKIIEISNNSSSYAYAQSGMLKYNLGYGLHTSLGEINLSIKIDSKNDLAYYNYALIALEEGYHKVSLSYLDKISKEKRNGIDILALKAYNHMLLEDYDEAEEHYLEIINYRLSTKTIGETYSNIGYIFSILGEIKRLKYDNCFEAIYFYDKSIEIQPNIGTYIKKSLCQVYIGDYTEALQTIFYAKQIFYGLDDRYTLNDQLLRLEYINLTILHSLGNYSQVLQSVDELLINYTNDKTFLSLKAESEYSLQKYNSSIATAKKSILINSSNDMRVLLARNYHFLESYEKAISLLNEIIDDNSGENFIDLANAYILKSISYFSYTKGTEHIKNIDMAIKYSKKADSNLTLAVSYFLKGLFEGDKKYINKAFLTNPNMMSTLFTVSSYLMNNQGELLDYNNRKNELEGSYKSPLEYTYLLLNKTIADELHLNNSKQFYSTLEIYNEENLARLNSKIKSLSQQLENISNNTNEEEKSKIYLYRGILNMYLNNYYLSRIDLERALSLNKNSFEAHIGLGLLNYLEKDMQAARKSLRKAIKISAYSPILHYYIGEVYLEEQDYSKAQDSFTKAVASSGSYDLAYISRGFSYAFDGDYKKATSDIHYYIYFNQNSYIGYLSLGFIEFMQLNINSAQSYFEKARDFNIDISETSIDKALNMLDIYRDIQSFINNR